MLISPRSMHSRRNNRNLSVSSLASTGSSSSSLLSPRTSKFPLSLSSPPISPSLPSLIPRHGKKPSPRSQVVRRVGRPVLILLCAGLAAVGYFGLCNLYVPRPTASEYPTYDPSHTSAPLSATVNGSSAALDIDRLPSTPSTLRVDDGKGRHRYTIAIPATAPFPLWPSQYRDLCDGAHEASGTLGDSGGHPGSTTAGLFASLTKRHRGYNTADPWFLDVADAERAGRLPMGTEDEISFVGGGPVRDDIAGAGSEHEPCATSLTFLLETSDAGLGHSLMQMWLAYGLAQKEGRAFFLDDTRWPYGRFADYFEPPPRPRCRPPPRTHVVPCPHNARHLVASAATTYYTFGHAFNEAFEDPRGHKVMRQRHIFELARVGYEALFKIRGEDGEWVEEHVQELLGNRAVTNADEDDDRDELEHRGKKDNPGPVVGMHVRRGDVHPFAPQYSDDYLPLDMYVDEARALADELAVNISSTSSSHSSKSSKSHHRHHKHPNSDSNPNPNTTSPPTFLLASDDPDIHIEPEVSSADDGNVAARRAQDRIMLASKRTLEAAAAADDHAAHLAHPNKYLDDISGWEGGFFRRVFWHLGPGSGHRGAPPSSTSDGLSEWESYEYPVVDEEDAGAADRQTMLLRSLVGRAYLLDLAVMGRADGVVCAASATACRLLAVMMGWERAIEQGAWRNVDLGPSWRGVIW